MIELIITLPANGVTDMSPAKKTVSRVRSSYQM